MTSPDFWAILQTLSSHSASAGTVFEILESGVAGSPPAIMADNYEAAIALLNSFASAASSAAASDQKADRKQTPQQRKAARPAKTQKSGSDNPAVARGIKAVNIIYAMTGRIPQLMKQSHLESNEGALFRHPPLHQSHWHI
jgi:brefeldin A-resistance guanine nucleotide exchange factor 1